MDKKKKINLRALFERRQEIQHRLGEIADLCETENRGRNEAEDSEYHTLSDELQRIDMRARAIDTFDGVETSSPSDMEKHLRSIVAAGHQATIRMSRDLMKVTDASTGGAVAVKIQDIVRPLVEGLITDKVGLPMPTGLAGDYVWPVYEAVEATIAGEGVALTDTKIPMSKLTAAPQRVGIAIPVTREALNQSEGLVETIVRQVIPLALQKLINKVLFSTSKITGATTLVGPFVAPGVKNTLTAFPTKTDFAKLKGDILKEGVDGDHLCFIMSKANKCLLEVTPLDPGSGVMMCANDHILGVPVYTTNYIGENTVGLGDWRYQPMGLFGDLYFIVDPYSQARKNAVDFVLNADYGTTTLIKKAFGVMTWTASTGA